MLSKFNSLVLLFFFSLPLRPLCRRGRRRVADLYTLPSHVGARSVLLQQQHHAVCVGRTSGCPGWPMVRLVIAAVACHIARLVANLGHWWQTLDAHRARPICASCEEPAHLSPWGEALPAPPSKARRRLRGWQARLAVSHAPYRVALFVIAGDSVVVTCFVGVQGIVTVQLSLFSLVSLFVACIPLCFLVTGTNLGPLARPTSCRIRKALAWYVI